MVADRLSPEQEQMFEEWRKKATPAHVAQYVTRELPDDSEAKWLPFAHHLYMNDVLVQDATSEARTFLNMSVAVRMGKQTRLDEPILTAAGWSTVGALKVGDKVFGPRGDQREVVALGPIDRASPKMRVTFTDRTSVDVHPDHEWTLTVGGRTKTFETRELARRNLGDAERGAWRYKLPGRLPLQADEADLPVPPYTLGVWLGDGKASNPTLSLGAHDEPEIMAGVQAEGVLPSSSWTHPGTGVKYHYLPILPGLRELGVIENKRIPDRYFVASEAQRRDLLQGLVDSDGHVEPKAGRVHYGSRSKELAEDVCALARTLGHRATVCSQSDTRPPHAVTFADGSTHMIPTAGVLWVANWTPHDGLPQGKVKRKIVPRLRKPDRVAVKSVEPVEAADGRCIQVDAEDGLFLVGRDLIPTHNSELISRYLPFWYLGMFPDRDVVIIMNTTDNAEKWGLATRNLMREFGPELFGLTVDPSNDGKRSWGIKGRKGTFRAVGIGTAIEGRGIHLGIIDDPLGFEEAMSPTERQKVWDWYTGQYRTRLMHGSTTVLVMSRWHCLLPGSTVEAADGSLVSIEDAADTPVSTAGGWSRPLAHAERQVDREAVEVQMYGLDQPLRVTSDHRVLTPDGWTEAGLLHPGSRVISRATPTAPWAPPAPPPARPAPAASSARAVLPLGVPAWHISVLHGAGYSDKMIGDRFGRSQQWARELRRSINGDTSARSLSPKAFGDPDFWWAMGLWVAEGSLTSGRKGSPNVVVWTLGWHERKYAERIRDTFERLGLTASIRPVRNVGSDASFPSDRACSSWTVRVSSRWLADVAREFGCGARNKKIPAGIEAMDAPLLRQFVDGAFAGDGTWQGDWLRYSTRSRHLAFGLRRCLAALGATPTVMKSGPAIEVRVKASDLDGTRPRLSKTENRGGDLIHTVKSITRFHYTGPVYDITTASHDFRAEGVTVHNCDDLAGRIERHQAEHPGGDPWRTVMLPIIAQAPKGAGPEWRNPIGQADGEPLWPERWPLDDLAILRKSVTAQTWESRYMQNPTNPEGGAFKVAAWMSRPHIDRSQLRLIRMWDLAATEGDGDWTVGLLMGLDRDNRVYIVDIQRFRKDAAGVKKQVLATAQADGRLVPIGIEQERAGAGKAQLADMKRLLFGYVVVPIKPDGKKEDRAAPYAAQQQDSNVYIVGDLDGQKDAFIEEHRVFPKGTHDDMVDAASAAFNWLAEQAPAEIVQPEEYGAVPLDRMMDLGFGGARQGFTIPVG